MVTNSKADDALSIRSDSLFLANMPGYLSPHPVEIFYSCRRIRLEQQTITGWHAVVTYAASTTSEEERERAEQPNPLLRRTKFSIDEQEFQRYATKDAEGTASVNSAGEPFPPQPMDDGRPVIHLRKNIASFNAAWFRLNRSANESSVTVFDGYSSITVGAGDGVLKGLKVGELQEENGVKFYVLTADIHIASDEEDKWKQIIIDTGYNYLDGTDIKRIQVKNPLFDSDPDNQPEFVDCVSE